ncbi:MAG TPA: DUF3822 family protein [Prolixibacteraceae bacterium]|nr:DUF3822 family protein [Prolixibacteraceae bacterium]HPS13127.1 DUF3822 family protein [Prolixibacteraceae bacterium]
MVKSRFIDESFDTNDCQNYILSIQCTLNGVHILVYNPVSNKFVALLDHEAIFAAPFELKNELENFCKNEPVLGYNYKKVNVSFLDHRSVMIPDKIIGEQNFEELFYLTFDKKRDEVILKNTVIPSVTSLLFSFPGVIYRCVQSHFPTASFFATPLPVIQYGLKQKTAQPQFLIFKFGDYMLICLMSDKKIHFFNHFYVKNNIDCLYYILSTAKKLNISSTIEMKLIGKIEPQSELISSLKSYFEKVEFARFRSNYLLSSSFPSMPEHYLLHHTELTLCE